MLAQPRHLVTEGTLRGVMDEVEAFTLLPPVRAGGIV
jgi:hypothetical protein